MKKVGQENRPLVSKVLSCRVKGDNATVKFISWEIRLGIYLVCLSILIYSIKYLIISDFQNTYVFVLNALGFLPINVLLVTVVLNKLLAVRSKRDRLEKINMVIGMFFSEMGTHLLSFIAKTTPTWTASKVNC